MPDCDWRMVRNSKELTVDPREVIKTSRMFWQLSDEHVDKLAQLCHEASYDAGTTIFNEGESANEFYIIVEGRVALEMELRIAQRARRRMTSDVLKSGDVLSWPALTDSPVHNDSAVCIENTKLLAFDGEAVRKLCAADPVLYRTVGNQIINIVAQRMSNAAETLARVLAVASHDLKAPLATIQSCIDLVCSGLVGDINEKQRELLSGAEQRASDLIKTINNLIDISQIQIRKDDFISLSLPELIQSCVGNVMGLVLRKRVRIETKFPPKLPQALGSHSRLQKVVDKLTQASQSPSEPASPPPPPEEKDKAG